MMEVQLKSDMNLCTGTITLVFCVPAVDVDGTGWDGAGMEGTFWEDWIPFFKASFSTFLRRSSAFFFLGLDTPFFTDGT